MLKQNRHFNHYAYNANSKYTTQTKSTEMQTMNKQSNLEDSEGRKEECINQNEKKDDNDDNVKFVKATSIEILPEEKDMEVKKVVEEMEQHVEQLVEPKEIHKEIPIIKEIKVEESKKEEKKVEAQEIKPPVTKYKKGTPILKIEIKNSMEVSE